MQVIATSGRADDLPRTLWVAILQLVPQQQRLSRCALVSKAWKAAAAQATIHVVQELSLKAAPAFNRWLARYADQLHSLRLSSCLHNEPVLTLPLGELKQLQHLQVEGRSSHIRRNLQHSQRWATCGTCSFSQYSFWK